MTCVIDNCPLQNKQRKVGGVTHAGVCVYTHMSAAREDALEPFQDFSSPDLVGDDCAPARRETAGARPSLDARERAPGEQEALAANAPQTSGAGTPGPVVRPAVAPSRSALVVYGEPSWLREGCCIANPAGPLVRRWDLVMSACLIFTAIVTPFEVALMEPELDGLFALDRIVDAVFVVVRGLCGGVPRIRAAAPSPARAAQDIFLQASLAYVALHDGLLVTNRASILRRYARCVRGLARRGARNGCPVVSGGREWRSSRGGRSSWLVLDVVSVLPFDTVGVVLDSREVASFKSLRLIRLFRLLKLLRILRATRILKRIEANMSFM